MPQLRVGDEAAAPQLRAEIHLEPLRRRADIAAVQAAEAVHPPPVVGDVVAKQHRAFGERRDLAPRREPSAAGMEVHAPGVYRVGVDERDVDDGNGAGGSSLDAGVERVGVDDGLGVLLAQHILECVVPIVHAELEIGARQPTGADHQRGRRLRPQVGVPHRAPAGERARTVVIEDVHEVGLHTLGLERGRGAEGGADAGPKRQRWRWREQHHEFRIPSAAHAAAVPFVA